MARKKPKKPVKPYKIPNSRENVLEDDGEFDWARHFAALTELQKRFVDRFLVHGQGIKAAREAGYSDASHNLANMAYKLLKEHPVIPRIIVARIREKHATEDQIIARLSEQAFGSMEDFLVFTDSKGNQMSVAEMVRRHLKGDEGVKAGLKAKLSLVEAAKNGQLHLIKDLDIKNGKVSIRMYDAQKAMEMLGKFLDLWKTHLSVSPEWGVDIDQFEGIIERVYGGSGSRGGSGASEAVEADVE